MQVSGVREAALRLLRCGDQGLYSGNASNGCSGPQVDMLKCDFLLSCVVAGQKAGGTTPATSSQMASSPESTSDHQCN